MSTVAEVAEGGASTVAGAGAFTGVDAVAATGAGAAKSGAETDSAVARMSARPAFTPGSLKQCRDAAYNRTL